MRLDRFPPTPYTGPVCDCGRADQVIDGFCKRCRDVQWCYLQREIDRLTEAATEATRLRFDPGVYLVRIEELTAGN